MLRYINAEHDIPYGGDELLFEILHYDFYQVPPIEVAKLTVEVNSRKHSGEQTSLRKLLSDKANTPPKDLFDKGLHKGLKELSGIIEKLIGYVHNITLPALFENTVREAGILAYIMNSPEKDCVAANADGAL